MDPSHLLQSQAQMQSTFMVVVPHGVYPGQDLLVTAPDGQQFSVNLPYGYSPGMQMPVVYTPLRQQHMTPQNMTELAVMNDSARNVYRTNANQRSMEHNVSRGSQDSIFDDDDDVDDDNEATLDLELAKMHGKNSFIKKRRFGAEPCPCGQCQFKHGGEHYSIMCNVEDLAPLGTGWILFFDFTRFVICLLVFFQVMYVGVAVFNATIPNAQEKLDCLAEVSFASEASKYQCTNDTDFGQCECQQKLFEAMRDNGTKGVIEAKFSTAGNWGPSLSLFGKEKCHEEDLPLSTEMKWPWVQFYHYTCLMGMIIAVAIYKRRQVQLILQAGNRIVTASEFSVLLDNLPPDCKDELDIIDMVHRVLGDENGPLPEFDEENHRPVIRVVILFNIGSMSKHLRVLEDSKAELCRRVILCRNSPRDKRKKMRKDIRAFRTKMHEAYAQVTSDMNDKLEAAAAIVVMRKANLADELLERLAINPVESFLRKACPLWATSTFFPDRQGAIGDDGYVVLASKPPNPSDIIWESYGPTFSQRCVRGLFAFCLSVGILIGTTFFMEKLIKWTKDPITMICKHGSKGDLNVEDDVKFLKSMQQHMPLAVTILVQLINFFYPYVCEALVNMRKPVTRTEKRSSEMWRIACFTIVNTVFVAFYVHAQHVDQLPHEQCKGSHLGHLIPLNEDGNKDQLWFLDIFTGKHDGGLCADFYSTGHLVFDVLMLLFSSVWLSPIMVAFPVYLIYKKALQLYYSCFASMEKSSLSQKRLNEVFEGPEPSLPHRYAHLLNILVLTLTYMPIVPITPSIAIVGLVAYYAANKYFLLRHAKTPYVQRHFIGSTALGLIIHPLVILPQPTLMCLLLSPSVEERKAMWHFVPYGTLALLIAIIIANLMMKYSEALLKRKKQKNAICIKGHQMAKTSMNSFLKKFEDLDTVLQENMKRVRCDICSDVIADFPRTDEEAVSWAASSLSGDVEDEADTDTNDPKMYYCPVCESMGTIMTLCDECGMLQRKQGSLKESNQTYERAKRLFVYQYWKVNPLYKQFQDFFSWQESDMDRAFQNAEDFELAFKEQDVDAIVSIIKSQAMEQGLQVAEKPPFRRLQRYAGELCSGPRKVIFQSLQDLNKFEEIFNYDANMVEGGSRRIGRTLLSPGWEAMDNIPTAEDIEKEPQVVIFERQSPAILTCIEELKEDPWDTGKGPVLVETRKVSEGAIEEETSRGDISSGYSEVTCDWSNIVHDPYFKMMYGDNLCCCPKCKEEFDSREQLIEHYNRTDHDIVLQ